MYDGNGTQAAGRAVGVTSVPKTETLPMALEDTLKLSLELRNVCGIVADNMGGGVPEDANCKAPSSNAVTDKVNEIRYTLREALRHQRRVMDTLGL
jgi:hypothetical protein